MPHVVYFKRRKRPMIQWTRLSLRLVLIMNRKLLPLMVARHGLNQYKNVNKPTSKTLGIITNMQNWYQYTQGIKWNLGKIAGKPFFNFMTEDELSETFDKLMANAKGTGAEAYITKFRKFKEKRCFIYVERYLMFLPSKRPYCVLSQHKVNSREMVPERLKWNIGLL